MQKSLVWVIVQSVIADGKETKGIHGVYIEKDFQPREHSGAAGSYQQ